MIEQTVIAVCGIASVWLSQSTNFKTARWACIFGLAAQPAWLYTTWAAQQWGIFALSAVYTVGWLRGVRIYWLSKEQRRARVL